MSLQQIVDIHCHFINFDYLPDKYTIHLVRNKLGDMADMFDEEDFKNPQIFLKFLLKMAGFLGTKYLDEFLRSMKQLDFENNPQVIDTLVNEGEYFLPQDMKAKYQKGRKGKLILFTPLMMDFIKAANMPTPTTSEGVIPFKQQLKEHVLFSKRYPWKIFPFFHYHPEREGVYKMFVDAIEKYGFIGVKLYPAMGFYPDCTHSKNDPAVNKRLKKLYDYIATQKYDYRIPITAHSQNSSTQAIDLTMPQTWEFTRISNWKKMIETYGLKINFAHYGGKEFSIPGYTEEKEFSKECRKTIHTLMAKYNKDGNKQIFADTSAHSKKRYRYFKQLNIDLNNPQRLIMFGTDLPVITGSTLNRDYINSFFNKIQGEDNKDRFFKRHAFDFLFEDGNIPSNYIDFLERNRQDPAILADPFAPENIPDFLTKSADGNYTVV